MKKTTDYYAQVNSDVSFDNFKNFTSYLKFKDIEYSIYTYIRPDKYILN